jgi:hypothetical protein
MKLDHIGTRITAGQKAASNSFALVVVGSFLAALCTELKLYRFGTRAHR